MVLSVLIAFGVVTGGSEGLKASQRKARREEHRSRKNNLIVHVPKSSEHSQILESRRIVLSGEKVRHLLFFASKKNPPFSRISNLSSHPPHLTET